MEEAKKHIAVEEVIYFVLFVCTWCLHVFEVVLF